MPIAPTWMLMRSDCAKTASPLATSDDTVRALPSTMRSQVSCFASRHHSEFGARSIRSNMKCAFQAQGDLGFRSSAQDVPGFGLAVLQSDRLRIRIVRVNLNRERLAREQQLEQ